MYLWREMTAGFQSTLPARGATDLRNSRPVLYSDFNPRSPHGERRYADGVFQSLPDISIHAPRTGSDPMRISVNHPGNGFQSTLPARGATLFPLVSPNMKSISIHAPRTGSDILHARREGSVFYISIHAPRTGSDVAYLDARQQPTQFQSTLPARGATRTRPQSCRPRPFQSTLPARGATGDLDKETRLKLFQSTLPARGATHPVHRVCGR